MEYMKVEKTFVVVVVQVLVQEQEQVYIEVDQVQELELDMVEELEQDMVEEQVRVCTIRKQTLEIIYNHLLFIIVSIII